MPVPDFQTLMLPVLKLLADGNEHILQESIDALAVQFQLTLEEREELLPSERQRRFDNRAGWALTYLRQAGLVERMGRGRYRITQRGTEAIAASPAGINMKYLERYPEYQDFRNRNRASDETEMIPKPSDEALTPEEALAASYQNLRQNLASVLLSYVKSAPPAFLERLVVELLVAMGYGGSLKDAGRAVGRSGDGGIDGIIKEDRLCLDAVYIQAKRWEGTVGRPEIQRFSGSFDDKKATKGVFITTSQFSWEARDYVERTTSKRIVLIDGEQLAQLMMDYGIGVTTVASYSVQKVDPDYFEGIDGVE